MVKILLIEDEKMLADMYKEKFVEAGYKIVFSPNAEEGIEIAKKEKPDLIILDILLQKANGISFLEKLRNDLDIASIAVVAFSNLDDPETRKRAMNLGVKDYLIKTNYTPQEIIDEIKKYLK
ncbi:response regulator [Patescibacteria group bacterium]